MAVSQPKTFMLLPDKMHKPDDDIHLGTILPLSKHTKLPDPDAPFNRYTRISPWPSDMRHPLIEKPWLYTGGRVLSGSAAINAEVPFVPVGGSFVLGRSKEENITIQCDRVETTRFVPNVEYLKQSMADRDVQQYCRGRWFPSVYMVTGIKVAYNANAEAGTTQSLSGGFDVSVDATAQGVPVNVGLSPKLNFSAEGKLNSGVEDAFILAYQLRRIKLRRDSTVRKHEPLNKHNLFSDDDDGKALTERDNFLESWEEAEVTVDTVHET